MASPTLGSIIVSGNRIKVKANLGGLLEHALIHTRAACSCTDIPLPLTSATKVKLEAEVAVHEIVKQLETRGIVWRCSSTTNSPCLPVPKPNGKWQLCIDYQH